MDEIRQFDVHATEKGDAIGILRDDRQQNVFDLHICMVFALCARERVAQRRAQIHTHLTV